MNESKTEGTSVAGGPVRQSPDPLYSSVALRPRHADEDHRAFSRDSAGAGAGAGAEAGAGAGAWMECRDGVPYHRGGRGLQGVEYRGGCGIQREGQGSAISYPSLERSPALWNQLPHT